MPDYTWDFDGTTVNGLQGSQPDRKLGEAGTWSFRLAPDPALSDHKTRANSILDYQPKAGGFVVWKTTDHEVRFREQQTGTPDLLVAIQASGSDLINAQSIWGLVESVSIVDDSQADSYIDLAVSVVYLADYGDYSTDADVRAALEE